VKSNLWQHIYVIQPVEAESEEKAREAFLEMTKTAKDVIIDAVVDEDGLEELLDDEPQEVIH
jgi:hypothetical protein